MVVVKSNREIENIRKAAEILVDVRKILKDMIKPGLNILELDKVAESEILKRNGLPAFKGYEDFPNTLCISVNDQVVHGIPCSYILKEGDIISIDMGVIYNGYYSDSARTYPVGKVSPEAEKLLDITKRALLEGIKKVKNGVFVSEISKAIENFVKPYKYGIVEEFTGHGIGRELHEDPYIPNYYIPDEPDSRLWSKCVICIEPMINLGTKKIKLNGWDARTKDGKPSAHFEDMILVKDDGYEILTVDKE